MPQTLTPAQTRALFLSALLLFVLPFILVDFPYVDDNWRIQLENGPEWRQQGRVLTELFYRLLTFSGSRARHWVGRGAPKQWRARSVRAQVAAAQAISSGRGKRLRVLPLKVSSR